MAKKEKPEISDKIEQEVINTLQIDEKVLKSLSIVVLMWSNLEHNVFILLKEILKIDWNIAAITLVEATFIQKMTMVTSLLHHSRNEELYYKWDAAKKKIETLRAKRNDLVHGFWNANEELIPNVTRLKARGKLSVDIQDATLNDLRHLYVDIVRSITEINSIRQFVVNKLPADAFTSPKGAPLDRTQSPKALAQEKARQEKKVSKASQREKASRQNGRSSRAEKDDS